MVRYSFLVRLSHPLLHAGFIPALSLITLSAREKLASQKFRHQRPYEVRQIGLVAIRFGRSEAMVAKMEIVPFQWLTI
jgi:hypothetical protein